MRRVSERKESHTVLKDVYPKRPELSPRTVNDKDRTSAAAVIKPGTERTLTQTEEIAKEAKPAFKSAAYFFYRCVVVTFHFISCT